MPSDEKIVRIESLDDFDRELARDGGEALEVPAPMAEEYGLFRPAPGVGTDGRSSRHLRRRSCSRTRRPREPRRSRRTLSPTRRGRSGPRRCPQERCRRRVGVNAEILPRTISAASCATVRSRTPEGPARPGSLGGTSPARPEPQSRVWRRDPRFARFPPRRSCSPSSSEEADDGTHETTPAELQRRRTEPEPGKGLSGSQDRPDPDRVARRRA